MVEEIEAMVSRKDFLATKIAEVSFVDQDFREKTSTSSIIGRIIIWNNLDFLCALCVIFPLRALREKKTQVSRKERKDFHAEIAESSFVDQDFREKTRTSSIIEKIIIWNNLNFLCALCVIFPLRALREKKTQVSRKDRQDFHAKIAESSFVNQDFREKPSTSSIIEKIIIWFNLNFLGSLCVILPLQALREKNYRQLTNINLEYNE